MEKLNVTAMLAGMVPASVTEYRMVNDRLAQVIVSASARHTTNELRTAVQASLGDAVAVVRESFRWLTEDKTSMIGFVALATPQRLLDTDKPEKAGYREVAKNMYISTEDESVWELKKSAVGTYMVRNGHDDLSELIETARVSPRGATPRMANIVNASAAPSEFISFVNSFGSAMPSIDHGFVVSTGKDTFSVVTATYDKPITIRRSEIVSSHSLDDKEVHQAYLAGAKRVNAAIDKPKTAEYYKKLYSYAPDYLKLVLKEISEMSSL